MQSIRWIGLYNSQKVWGHKEVGITFGWYYQLRKSSLNVFLWKWFLVIGPHFYWQKEMGETPEDTNWWKP